MRILFIPEHTSAAVVQFICLPLAPAENWRTAIEFITSTHMLIRIDAIYHDLPRTRTTQHAETKGLGENFWISATELQTAYIANSI